jgi:hypothetical protein
MCDEAAASGLALNPAYLSYFRDYPQGLASRKSGFYKVGDAVMRPIRGFRGLRKLGDAPEASLNESVLKRLNADPAKHESLGEKYRPKNLLRFLADNPQYDAELEPGLRKVVMNLR